MTPAQKERLLQLFGEAEGLAAAARARFCEVRCSDDPKLRVELAALLEIDTDRVAYLESPLLVVPPEPADPGPATEPAPTDFGPFRVLDELGEGGMGTVYRAEQLEPVRREVALKVIRSGMDSRRVVRRFEAERHALARMDHPGIARIHEAGSTPAGRPWFAMELVAGPSLVLYCDTAGLGLRDRVQLFCRVCDAVQHAHQKGVIHRDLKPSNVLVAERDGEPEPKVIDFGIARATAEPLTDHDLTRLDEIVGTLDYMSPEQLARQGDVDSRADIFALGVMLYELLAGELPYASESLATKSIDEVQRLLRDRPPPPPSRTRKRAAGVAVRPPGCEMAARGDLDWVTLKALAYDRERRYASASEFASDLRRHLAHEPVLARPPRLGYRLRCYVRRHRVLVATALLVLVSLLAGVVVAARFAVESERQASVANARMEQLFDALSLWYAKAVAEGETLPLAVEFKRLRTDLCEAAQPGTKKSFRAAQRAAVRSPRARVAANRELADVLRSAPADPGSTTARAVASLIDQCAIELLFDGEAAAIEPALRRAAELRALDAPDDPRFVWTQALWLDSLVAAGRAAEAVELAVAWRGGLLQRGLSADHPAVAVCRAHLAAAYLASDLPDAAARARAELDRAEPVLRSRYGSSYHGLHGLATGVRLADAEGDTVAALALRKALAAGRSRAGMARHYPQGRLVLGMDGADLWDAILRLRAAACSEAGDPATAITAVRALADAHGIVPRTAAAAMVGVLVSDIGQGVGNVHGWDSAAALAVSREVERWLRPAPGQGERYREYAWAAALLANALVGREAFAEAEPFARRALAAAPVWPADDPELQLVAGALLGRSLAGQGEFAAAEPLLLDNYRGLVARFGVQNGNAVTALRSLLAMYGDQGTLDHAMARLQQANAWRDEPTQLRLLGEAEIEYGLEDPGREHLAEALRRTERARQPRARE